MIGLGFLISIKTCSLVGTDVFFNGWPKVLSFLWQLLCISHSYILLCYGLLFFPYSTAVLCVCVMFLCLTEIGMDNKTKGVRRKISASIKCTLLIS